MRELQGKTAIVTGAGSGIGEGTAHALAEAGMNIAIVDIDGDAAQRVAAHLRNGGANAIGLQCDVTDRQSMDAMAEAVYDEFEAVHVLHNNAGICFFAPVESTSDEQWRLTLDVNLNGVINGLQAFLPRIRSQRGEAHIVNTASLAGLLAGPALGAYNATKFAVVAISETMRQELAPHGIGVSVLCPGGVATNIMRNSMALTGTASARTVEMMATEEFRVIDPIEVGRIVRAGIEANEPYILTHPEFKRAVQGRFERILEAFDRAAANAPHG
jgi:NAD(P)-dependent dehydrogenase (short-subunit alcohol dehydrogenase family)